MHAANFKGMLRLPVQHSGIQNRIFESPRGKYNCCLKVNSYQPSQMMCSVISGGDDMLTAGLILVVPAM